jgi:hypothetical protein
MEKIYAGHDGFDDLALPCAALAYNTEQHLLPPGRIRRVFSPRQSLHYNLFDHRALFDVQRDLLLYQGS